MASIPLSAVKEKVECAGNCFLAEDIYAPHDLPFFENSAMDGYAGRMEDFFSGAELPILNVLSAGDPFPSELPPKTVAQIFTGAPIPKGADTVIRREDTQEFSDKINILIPPAKQGQNVRKKGEQIQKGSFLLKKGHRLTPASIGLMAGLGIAEILIYPKPIIGLIVTGDELIKAGTPWIEGKIYESHSAMLISALEQLGITQLISVFAKDTQAEIAHAIEQMIPKVDCLFLTGGVSMGDKDFVKPALIEVGAVIQFHKIKQKPGKPLLFAKHQNIPILAFPGNPASVLTGYYIYGLPLLQNLMGNPLPQTKWQKAPLKVNSDTKPGLMRFFRAVFQDQELTISGGQDSNSLVTYAHSNAIVKIPENVGLVNAGEIVSYILI